MKTQTKPTFTPGPLLLLSMLFLTACGKNDDTSPTSRTYSYVCSIESTYTTRSSAWTPSKNVQNFECIEEKSGEVCQSIYSTYASNGEYAGAVDYCEGEVNWDQVLENL